MKKILLAAAIIVAMTSCSKSDNTNPNNPAESSEIKLSAGLDGSKVAHNGDVAVTGLQFLRKDATGVVPTDFSDVTAITGSRAVAGAITFDETVRYGSYDNAYFVSYYPAGTYNSNVVTWEVDGKTDIMTAAMVDAGTQQSHAVPAKLSYQHMLAQIEIRCVAENNDAIRRWGTVNAIRLMEAIPQMTYSYATQAVSATGAPRALTLLADDYTSALVPFALTTTNDESNAVAMVVVPTSADIKLEIDVTGGTENTVTKPLTVKLNAGEVLKAGFKHIITLSFNNPPDNEIKATSTVEPWDAGSTGGSGIN